MRAAADGAAAGGAVVYRRLDQGEQCLLMLLAEPIFTALVIALGRRVRGNPGQWPEQPMQPTDCRGACSPA